MPGGLPGGGMLSFRIDRRINLDKSKICLKCFDDERFSSVIKKMQLILTLSTPKELDLYYIGLGKLFFCNKID